MCDQSCINFGVAQLNSGDIKDKTVLEIGSYNVNGTLREWVEMLEPKKYIGVDLREGPDVDIVCDSNNLMDIFKPESFDLVISTCTLEHTENWKLCISNMKKLCSPGGIILIIVPSVWPIHDYPNDYWRFSKQNLADIFSDFNIITLIESNEQNKLVYIKAVKPSDKYIENDISNILIKPIRRK